ncbi:MAG: ABC transporter ATP-binding protein [Planctomycetota bacterium]
MLPAVHVENLSKAYRIGLEDKRERPSAFAGIGGYLKKSIRDTRRRLSEDWTDENDTFWALSDVNFTVDAGETVGLIGRNGAGKSTLLKILSRIVEPTEGKITLRGRVSSLLEVGTGFHPELTGRENVYLNGAILGMRREEIKRKFDDIVEFSEVGKFLDTPVKRYSSGMYVRLAFSVAAHLDPQIMIVDEVLAVGDASFQKKCLGKMNDVVKEGRTVLFVSHQMDAVASLCGSVMVVDGGKASERLPTEEGITRYLGGREQSAGIPLADRPRTTDRERPPIFVDLQITDEEGKPTGAIATGRGITFDVTMADFDQPGNITAAVALLNGRGQRVALFHSEYNANLVLKGTTHKKLRCHVPSLPLAPGTYHVELVAADGFTILERLERAADLEVVYSDLLGTGKVPNSKQSTVVLPANWQDLG